jgi:hypothetical protein
MKTAKRFLVVLMLILPVVSLAQSQEKPATKISNTRAASCLVRVTCDPAVLPLNFKSIDDLLHSSGVGGTAAREALDVSPDQAQELFTIGDMHELATDAPAQPSTNNPSAFAAKEQTYLFSLNVHLSEEVKPAAEEFTNALISHLRLALDKTFKECASKLESRLDLAQKEAAQAEKDFRQTQDMLRKVSSSRDIDRHRILADIEDLRREIQQIKVDQASEGVVASAATQQIAEIKARIRTVLDRDAISGELGQLLSLQEENLENVEKLCKSGRASGADLADAHAKVARGRIDWTLRREQLSKSAGGNLIESLNSELANHAITQAQNQARLSSLEEQVKEADELLGKADDYELLSLKADAAAQNLREIILSRDRLSRQIRMSQPPSVSVVGGD